MIPFVRDFDFAYGRVDWLSPLIRRVVADNPGPFTYTGTATFIVGREEAGSGVAVIDPGPLDVSHLEALVAAVDGQAVSHILITHTHRDHVPLAHPFAGRVGNPPILAARPPALTTHPSVTLDEGDEEAFAPDHILEDGDMVNGDGWAIETLATPGHASNHLAFALLEENALFTGDHVMGWSTTIVAPPDGNMADYMSSLDKVMARQFDMLLPTHGPPVADPAPFLEAYRDHRRRRETLVLNCLAAGPRTIQQIVPKIYAAVDQRLWPAAGLSVWAHLIALAQAGRVEADPAPELNALWQLI